MIAHTAGILWWAFAAALAASGWIWWTERKADTDAARAELKRRALRNADGPRGKA
ncbi:MAG TPA: hypothetical protein VN513_09855 [Gemmatimonadales bacterium]|nr:hypothetical protein [Gemmatimonadales bacterium]